MPDQQFARGVSLLKNAWETISVLARGESPEWRKDYLLTRRAFMEAIAIITAAVGRMPEDRTEDLRARLRGLTTTLALHQADWPVVSIDPRNADYVTSMRNVHRSLRAFLDVAEHHAALLVRGM